MPGTQVKASWSGMTCWARWSARVEAGPAAPRDAPAAQCLRFEAGFSHALVLTGYRRSTGHLQHGLLLPLRPRKVPVLLTTRPVPDITAKNNAVPSRHRYLTSEDCSRLLPRKSPTCLDPSQYSAR